MPFFENGNDFKKAGTMSPSSFCVGATSRHSSDVVVAVEV